MDGKAASADVNSSSTEKVKPIKDMQGVKEAYPSINEKPAQKPAILNAKWRCLKSHKGNMERCPFRQKSSAPFLLWPQCEYASLFYTMGIFLFISMYDLREDLGKRKICFRFVPPQADRRT